MADDDSRLRAVESQVLRTIDESRDRFTPHDLVKTMGAKGANESMVRTALLHLLDHEKIELTRERKLEFKRRK